MKILVIGSGPIIIGQAAEFDYAGTQACKSLREEGHTVVLINSNPATIMTDSETADAVYIEPLTPYYCERVIARERPDGLLPTLGGQTGLNLATQLSNLGILEKYGVKLLGTPLSAIQKAEDRQEFRQLMREIKEPVPESWIIETPEQLEALLDVAPYPCIVRPAYTLGGTGGGIANTREELWATGNTGLKLSMRSQVMIERSLLGWKEVEYEVMRDRLGNCITICNMENFDPMGVHTGDSIVVAPSQTLSDIEYHMLRTASLKIIRALGIEGGCNVQLAVNPESFDYYVIEVNPRVSRSSALASKATGYPIARVSAKVAVGKTLDEIDNQVTGSTKACFEPALDYCVVKIPRWPFDKFASGDRTLFTQMKATGEVMAIDRSFESAFLKAIRGLEVKSKDLRHEGFQGSAGHGRDAHETTGETPVPRDLKPRLGPDILASGDSLSKVGHQDDQAPETWHGRHAHGLRGVSPVSEKSRIREYPDFYPSDEPITTRNGAYLPHWRQAGGTYFVTFRLADSLPQEKLEAYRSEAEALSLGQSEGKLGAISLMKLSREHQARVDRWLDSGHGSCALRTPILAELVQQSLLHGDGESYDLASFCVMPNHVHLLIRPLGDQDLSKIIHSIKSFTSHQIKKVNKAFVGWQAEYYDRVVRDSQEFRDCVEYIVQNPIDGHLENWPFVSLYRGNEIGKVSESRATYLSAPDGHGRDVHEASGETPVPLGIAPMSDELLREAIRVPTDERLWAIAEGLRRGYTIAEVHQLSRVDNWFLAKMMRLIEIEQRLAGLANGGANLVEATVREAAEVGYSGESIRSLTQAASEKMKSQIATTLAEVESEFVFKMVDTCAGEFESQTPYYYASHDLENDAILLP